MPDCKIKNRKTSNYVAIVCLTSILSLPRSFLYIKLSLLLILLFFKVFEARSITKFKTSYQILLFYLVVALLGLTWGLIGLHYGNPVEAILDNLRLYVLWSMCFIVLFALLDKDAGLRDLHASIITSAYMIFAINIVGVVDHVAQTGILSFDLRKELDLFVGFHEGYIQITSHNIGSLFFIAAYLYVYLVSNTSRPKKTQFGVYAALILCLITAALSGRRALWIVLLLVPVVDYIMSILCAVTNQTKSGKMLGLYILLMLVLMYLLLISSFSQNEIMEHVGNAFSNEDERSIQFGYLLASFLEYPILGSGFGGYAGYTRSLDSPWLYELTYLQILFNFGIVGVLLIVIVFLIYFYMVVVNLRDRSVGRGYRAALFIGCVSLLIGAYSNPYLGSFDFLFVVGMIPYVAQFNNRTRST